MAKRKRYTEEDRARILSAAATEGLTGKQASKKFGVSGVTLWKWRKASKPARERGARLASANGTLASLIRAEVRAKVREVLPGIVREEATSYLQRVFARRGQ